MQVKESYDLIVIGDQLSGLMLAAGAAEEGRRVLVLQLASVPTASYEVPSGLFLGDFACEPVIGLQENSAADSFLRSLGLYQKLEDLFPLHNPPLQIVGRGHRFDFPYETSRLQAELAREFPTRPSLARLLSGAMVERGSFSQAVEHAGLPVSFDLFGWMQAGAYGAMAPADISYPAYKEILALAGKSVRFSKGGRSAVAEHLLNRIKLFGGAIKRSTRVEEIVFERGKLSGVLLSSFEGFVRSKRVVGAMGAQTFCGLVPPKFQNSALQQAVKRVRPRFWRFTFTLLLPEDALPEGMGTHLTFGEGENFMQLQIFPKDVYGGIPARHRAVVVRTLVPFEPHTISEISIARHLKKSLVGLRALMPFLPEKPVRISPNPENLGQDPVFQRYYRFKDLDHIPPIFLAYESGLSAALDQSEFLDWSRFGLPGLALCSRDVYPLFGTTGEIFAAMDMLALMRKNKKDKLRGQGKNK